MSKELTTFDYDGIDKDTKSKLQCLAGQVKRHEKDFIKSGMEIGEAISAAHELLAGDGRDGKFKSWIELETGLSRTSAYDWMNAYERSKKCPILDTYPATVTLLLSSPTVPDAAIKDFEKQIDKGAKPTVAAAKATIERFREPTKPSSGPSKPPITNKPTTPSDSSIDRPKTDNAKQGGGSKEQPITGPCVNGSDHEIDDDKSGPLFSKLLEHLRQCTLLLDQLNKVARNDKRRQDAFDSLDCANTEILAWRKQAKK